MFAVPEGPSEAKIPITVRRIHLIRRPYAKRRGRRETMFDCPLSKTVKILDQRSCSIPSHHRSGMLGVFCARFPPREARTAIDLGTAVGT
jgi:hypothetical protein